eukprot:TRINITY_DN4311_c0_g1_i1.p1 TRINITY_DN4311_c0_g1~~TRINITY_DN4311_c0_g1_i1.p1  ORF type:complete len:561 (+),score=153.58 TRINITY_DN4311_c0_g1_i1:62-1684(+)
MKVDLQDVAAPASEASPRSMHAKAYLHSIGGASPRSSRPPVKWKKLQSSVDVSTKQYQAKAGSGQTQGTQHPHPHQPFSPWLVDVLDPSVVHKYWEDVPPPRTKFTTVVHNGKLVVYGGGLQKAFHSDLYIYHLHSDDPTKQGTWERIQEDASQVGGPCARRSHKAVLRGNEMILFGGRGTFGRLNDVFSLNLDTYEWTNRTPSYINGPAPVERAAHSCVLWRNRKMLVYGGDYESKEGTQSYLQDVWELDVNTYSWRELHPVGDIPAARLGHDAAISEDSMFIFGGYQLPRLNDIFVLDLLSGVWRRVWRLHAIKPTSFLSMAAVPASRSQPREKKARVGRTQGKATNPSWPYLEENGGSDLWSSDEIPNERASSLIIWGGSHPDTNTCTDVLLRFDIDSESFEELSVVGQKPSARLGQAMAQCNGNVYLIGGCDNTYYNDMYELDLSEPTLLETMRHYVLSRGIKYKGLEDEESNTAFLQVDGLECESVCDESDNEADAKRSSSRALARTSCSSLGSCQEKCAAALATATSSSALKHT